MRLDTESLAEAQASTGRVEESNFKPSPQQQAFLDWVKDPRPAKRSMKLVAVAGAGKTELLVQGCALMPGSVGVAQYNKQTAVAFNERLKLRGITHVIAKTFHAFGLQAWSKLHSNPKVDRDKVRDILEGEFRAPYKLIAPVSRLVSIAKQNGMGILDPEPAFPSIDDDSAWEDLATHFDILQDIPDNGESDEDGLLHAIELARAALKASNKITGLIDFDDMIYLPLKENAPFWKNDWVLIDEAQDSNPVRRLLASRMLKPGGRLVAVGDPHQAIYGFTGASADSLNIIQRQFDCGEMPLTITFRCPRKVVSHAQKLVSHIEAHPSAPEGSVSEMTEFEFRKTELTREKLGRDTAILCRLTKPLVSLAFELIRAQIPCHVEGKEIGKGLISLCKKWKTVHSLDELETRLQEYEARECAKFREKRQEQKAEALSDRIETIFVIMEHVRFEDENATVRALISAIESLFGDSGESSRDCTLSTVHKAKGREWKHVYLWGRNKFMPSKYAKQDWQLEQETNLIYVAVTRAMESLVEVTLV